MESRCLVELLIETANQLGLEVRYARRSDRPPSEPPLRSGLCKVAGTPWVVLATDDPLEFQIETLAGALRESAVPEIESLYLPPIVRTVIAAGGAS